MLWKIDVGKTRKILHPCAEEIGVEPTQVICRGAFGLEQTFSRSQLDLRGWGIPAITSLTWSIPLIWSQAGVNIGFSSFTPHRKFHRINILVTNHFYDSRETAEVFFLYFNTSSLLTITVNGDRWMMLVRIRMLLWKGLSHNAKVTKSAGIVENF